MVYESTCLVFFSSIKTEYVECDNCWVGWPNLPPRAPQECQRRRSKAWARIPGVPNAMPLQWQSAPGKGLLPDITVRSRLLRQRNRIVHICSDKEQYFPSGIFFFHAETRIIV